MNEELKKLLIHHLSLVYVEHDIALLAEQLIKVMGLDKHCENPIPHQNNWDETDIAVITYADTFLDDNKKPLEALKEFGQHYLKDKISIMHILPFFPYSSDDGFSVIDYLAVNESHGNWDDIEALGEDYKLMGDVVLNHMSARSRWFENFKKCVDPGKDYFYHTDKDADISQVVRPRTSPLLVETQTEEGEKYVWCTFSEDQVDLNFSNPQVLVEFANILHHYLRHGIEVFRLDAVAFLWKEPGTPSIHLQQTHEIIKILRILVEHSNPKAIIITETNVPNRENLTYFGNANEAHVIYNFSLPPLLINTLISGSCLHLKTWLMSMPPAQSGTAYLNFIASHDGIGLRPTDGLLDPEEKGNLIGTMERFGAKITHRRSREGANKAYEINISLFDALQGTIDGPDQHQQQRFICAHTIMLALEGIPAFYIHSLLATENDYHRMEHTGRNRSINRSQWQLQEIKEQLTDSYSHHHKVHNEIMRLIDIRKQQLAFHPNATQYTLHLGKHIFAFWRQSINRRQSIFCLSNICNKEKTVNLANLNLIGTDTWSDLISGENIAPEQKELKLKPYQTVWLSNI